MPSGFRRSGQTWPRATALLVAGALLVSISPASGTDLTDEQRIEQALDECARHGTVKGRLLDAAAFDNHADACPLSPNGWDDVERQALIAKGKQLFASTTALRQQPSTGPTVNGQTLACASCHRGQGRTDGRTHLVGPTKHRDLVPRHTPHLLRIGNTAPYGWDGRFKCLQASIKNAIVSPLEMNAAREPTQEQLDALALFVETLDAPDAVPGVDYDPVLAQRGEKLFAQYRGHDLNGEFEFFDGVACLHCHTRPNGTDRKFHEVLLPPPFVEAEGVDPGHIDSTGKVRGFKTPVLRGVRLTAPYFHDGSMGVPGGVEQDPVPALLEMMEAYRARFAIDFTPEEQLALVHYLLSQ